MQVFRLNPMLPLLSIFWTFVAAFAEPLDPGIEKVMNDVQRNIYVNCESSDDSFDPSNKTATVKFNLQHTNGSFREIQLFRSSGNVQRDLGCVEAVANALPVKTGGTELNDEVQRVEMTFSPAYKTTAEWSCPWHCAENFFQKHPDQLGKVVVVHAIPPRSAIRFYGPMADEQIHCEENLRTIEDTPDATRRYLQAYKVWDALFKENQKVASEQISKAREKFDESLKTAK